MRAIIRGIVNNEYRSLKELGLDGKKIIMVCTILDENAMITKYNTQTGEPYIVDLENATLSHWRTVFFEDRGHDWDIYGDRFKFHAHSSDIGDSVDLLIEYE